MQVGDAQEDALGQTEVQGYRRRDVRLGEVSHSDLIRADRSLPQANRDHPKIEDHVCRR